MLKVDVYECKKRENSNHLRKKQNKLF